MKDAPTFVLQMDAVNRITVPKEIRAKGNVEPGNYLKVAIIAKVDVVTKEKVLAVFNAEDFKENE